MLTLHHLSFLVIVLGDYRFPMLQLLSLSHFSSKFQSSMTICRHIFFKTKLWKISVDYKFFELGIAPSSSVDEIFGHVWLLLRIHLLGFFCLFLIIWRRLNPLGLSSKNHVCLEPMQWLWNVTCLGTKKAYENSVCMGSLKKVLVYYYQVSRQCEIWNDLVSWQSILVCHPSLELHGRCTISKM